MLPNNLLIYSFRKFLTVTALFLLAALFTVYVVSWSFQNGKLAFPPDYDDSYSLVEGALRLDVARHGGVSALIQDYFNRNPHSFLHYYWTSLLFAIFGVSAAVPYWANMIFLFGVLLSFWSLLPRISQIEKWNYTIAFLGMPIAFHLVHDYRSEVTMASLLFMACSLVLASVSSEKKKTVYLIGAGILFGLSYAVKPVMFLYTLGMMGLCSIVILAKENENIFRLCREAILRVSILWAVAVLPVLPHFWIHEKKVFGYIYDVVFGSKYYHIPADMGPTWSFHWLGYSGVWHLGGLNIYFAVILIAGLFLFLVPPWRKYAFGIKWLYLAFLTIGAFAGIAINSVEQPFFGMTFQLLLVASALSAHAAIFQKGHPIVVPIVFCSALGLIFWKATLTREFLFPVAVGGVVAAAVLLYTKVPFIRWLPVLASVFVAGICWKVTKVAPYNNYVERTFQEAGTDGIEWRRFGPAQLYKFLEPLWSRENPPVVWVAGYGWIDANTLSWESAIRGKPWRMFNYTALPIPEGMVIPKNVDYIIVPEPGITGWISSPISSKTAEVWAATSSMHNLQLVATLRAPNGKKLALFKVTNQGSR
jgi:hypothetical protein